jgi:hypothetical protein
MLAMFEEMALSRVRWATNPLVLTSKIGNMGRFLLLVARLSIGDWDR